VGDGFEVVTDDAGTGPAPADTVADVCIDELVLLPQAATSPSATSTAATVATTRITGRRDVGANGPPSAGRVRGRISNKIARRVPFAGGEALPESVVVETQIFSAVFDLAETSADMAGQVAGGQSASCHLAHSHGRGYGQ
jgi:hypothetical protein